MHGIRAELADGVVRELQVQRESQMYEDTLRKMNQQLQASLDLMAGEKAALQLSLAGLQDQFEGVAQAVYTADEAVMGKQWGVIPVSLFLYFVFVIIIIIITSIVVTRCY